MKTLMYLVGVIMVSCGVFTLMFIGILLYSIFTEGTANGALIALGVAIVSCFILTFFGINLVRIGESEDAQVSDPNSSDLYSQLVDPNESKQIWKKDEGTQESTFETMQQKFANFDLSKLNWRGWMLFMATIAFAFVLCLITAFCFKENVQRNVLKLIGGVVFFSTIGFFVVVKLALSALGISIWRD